MNGVAATHPMRTKTIDAAKIPNPSHESSLRLAYMKFKFRRTPVGDHKVTCITMKKRNHTMTRKCTECAVWMLGSELRRLNRGGQCR